MSAGSNHRKVGDTVCEPNGDTGRHVRMGLDHILSILMPDPIFMSPSFDLSPLLLGKGPGIFSPRLQ